MESTILLVDDEQKILRLLAAHFKAEKYRILTAENGLEALQVVKEEKPDLVVLDILMPKMDGLEALRRLREFSDIPVIILSQRKRDSEIIEGLRAGADDYVTKPFNPDELLARVRAILRRVKLINPPQELTFEGEHLFMDFNRYQIIVGGEKVKLSKTEWKLLEVLVNKVGCILTSGDILAKVWGLGYREDVAYLPVWISRLRKKIERDPSKPKLIHTISGIGYKFELVE